MDRLPQLNQTLNVAASLLDEAAWAAAGSMDTLLRWSLKSEGGNGYETAVQSGVQV